MNNFFLYVIVFISGAAVLAIEILGTRILGPFYGVSLFLWSALITVTLLALSVGYTLGGRLADKLPKFSFIFFFLAGAGLWCLLIPLLKGPVLIITEPLGLRAAVLLAAFILFVPPLTLLGMVNPYAIRIHAKSLNVVGRTAGDLYAISTVGSVLSALLTGFILIPNIGVGRLTFMVGAVLVLTAASGLVLQFRSKAGQASIGLIVVLVAIGSVLIHFERPDPEQGLVAVEQSPYAEIRVLDVDDRRYLLIDGGTHTIVDPETWESHFPYTAVVDLSREFFEKPGDLLLIGLGGGSVVKNFAQAGWRVDAVEIDPLVVKVAQEYFGLQETEGTIYTMDGRRFLIANEQTYDIIVMDAFGSSSIPFHLVTKESFQLIASRMTRNGILAINTEAVGWNHILIRSLAATLKQSFENVLVLPAYKNPEEIGNVIIFASDRELKLSRPIERDIMDLNYRSTPAFHQNHAWDNRFSPDIHGSPVLTDDLNPVDLWAEAINLEARRNLHSFFESGLSW